MSAIRLLLIGPRSTSDASHRAGGIETGIGDLLREFGSPEHADAVALTHLSNGTSRDPTKRGRVDVLNVVLALRLYLRLVLLLLRGIVTGRRIAVCQVHTSGDISFLKDSVLVLIARVFGAQVVVSIHGYGFERYLAGLRGPMRRYARFIFARFGGVRVLAGSVAEAVRDEMGVDPARIHYVQNGVDTERFTTASASDGFVVLFVGGFGTVKRKGALDLLAGLRVLLDGGAAARVRIVGTDAEPEAREAIEAYCREHGLGDAVDVEGGVEHRLMPDVYGAAAVYCLPSYREGAPHSVLEAMAAGLPVVATRISGLPHLIEEGEGGFLIEPGDVPALAEHLQTLYDDPELRKAMGLFNRRRAVERFSVKAQADALIDIYRSLVQGPAR